LGMVCKHVVTSMGPRNAYKDMLDNVVSPIACVSMNHQNQLQQMANGAMFATYLLKKPYVDEMRAPYCEESDVSAILTCITTRRRGINDGICGP
jgi:hypothetical protein